MNNVALLCRATRLSLLVVAMLALSSGLAQSGCDGQTIEHEMGTTCVPEAPQRIVTLEYSYADHLAKLGVTPVGIAREANIPAYLEPYVGAVPGVGTRAEPNLEAIVALRPDLIVADLRRHEAIYDQLSAIAPTLVFDSLRGSYEDQLEAFEKLGEALGLSDEAATALEEHRAAFDRARDSVSPDAPSALIGVLSPGLFTAHSSQSFMGSFLASLGVPAAVEPRGGETQFSLSLEGIAAVQPQALVLLCNPADSTPLDEWAGNPVWSALDAVSSDRVYVFNRDLWSKGRGVIAFDLILEDLAGSGLLTGQPSSTPQSCQGAG
ncbi:MAG TPA: ABC transporter substrate-binding protein [Trueperaceae bacterium]